MVARDADDLFQLGNRPRRVGVGQVDFVDNRQNLEVVVNRQISVLDGLRLDPL